MRKNINKLATLVMTGALATSMSFGAFAAVGVSNGKTISIKKDVTTDGKTMAPKTNFELLITVPSQNPGNVEVKDNEGNGKQTYYDVKAGKLEGIQKTAASFDPAKVGTEGGATVSSDGKIYTSNFGIDLSGVNFTEAGIYQYTVKEQSNATDSTFTDYKGITYDTTEYTMFVFAENVTENNTTTVQVKNVVFAKTVDGALTKVDTIANKYGSSDDTTDKVHQLEITKVVDGALANMSEKFKFDITVNADESGEQFKIVKVVNGNEEAVTIGEGTNATTVTALTSGSEVKNLPVENGTVYRIYGLTDGDEVVVKEQEANLRGYVSTYAVTGNAGSAKNGNADKDGNVAADKKTTLTENGASVHAYDDAAKLIITNKKEAVTPTGVAMDIAPYALMVALASGAAATFLRKKESFED